MHLAEIVGVTRSKLFYIRSYDRFCPTGFGSSFSEKLTQKHNAVAGDENGNCREHI